MSALHGCGGSSGAKPTPKCVLNSDCRMGSDASSTLVCALGFCVSPCNDSGDCAAGQLCIKSDNGNACRAPEAAKGCVLNSDCTKLCTSAGDDGSVATPIDGGTSSACPIVCGRDQSCRTECATDVDCPGGTLPDGSKGKQKCTVSGACIDPVVDMSIYDPATNDFKSSVTGTAGTTATTGMAGTTGTAGSAAAGTTGTAGAGTAGTTGTAGSTTADGGAGTTGTAGTGTDAGGNIDAPLAPMSATVAPNAQLRQGQGIGITITIVNAAGGLSNPTGITLGDLKVSVVGTSTDTNLVLGVIVPHAVPLGKRTLKLSTKGGNITETDIVEVTAITASPLGSDATTNVGTVALPFRSLKQAIAVADVGDTIHLVDGTYSALPAASGGSAETWTGYTLPTDLTVFGDTTAGTILDGVGISNVDGFDVLKNLTLKNMTLQDFRYGVDLSKDTSTLSLTDVAMTANSSNAIYVDTAAMGSTVTIAGAKTVISQTSQPAIYVSNSANVTVNITDATIQSGGDVVYFYYNPSGAKLNVTNATLKALTTNGAINFYSANAASATGSTIVLMNATIIGTITDGDVKGSLTITGGTITQKSGDAIATAAVSTVVTGTTITMTVVNSGNGVNVTSGIGSTVALTNVTITGGGRGIYQSGNGSSVKLRGTTIQNTGYDAYYLTQGNLDLGTATEVGGNSLLTPLNAGYYCLNIYRSSGTATAITASGTAIGAAGAVPAPSTVDATASTSGVSNPYKWYVYPGNKLVFY